MTVMADSALTIGFLPSHSVRPLFLLFMCVLHNGEYDFLSVQIVLRQQYSVVKRQFEKKKKKKEEG